MADPNQVPGVASTQGHYAPNQPYFPGLAGIPNQELVATPMDLSKVQALDRPTDHDYRSGYLTCPLFFSSLGDDSFESVFDFNSWDYDLRREAQMLLPYLWIGPYTAAQNEEFIRREGITMLLAVRNSHPAYRVINGDKVAERLGIASEHIEFDNLPDLTPRLVSIIRGINDHVCRCGHHASSPATGGRKKVLVFCETGNEKSVGVALAYLMAMLNMDLHTATSNVQARRLSVNLKLELVKMLNAFDSMLVAHRDIAAAEYLSNPHSTARKRRAHEQNEFEPNTQNPAVQAAMEANNPGEESGHWNPYPADNIGEDRQPAPPFCDV